MQYPKSLYFISALSPSFKVHYYCISKVNRELYTICGGAYMAKTKKIDKDMGFRIKKARIDQKLTYD